MDVEVIKRQGHLGTVEGCGPLQRVPQDMPRSLRQQVFEFVRAQGHAARSDITHALGISAGSATTLTADLISSGYLREFERQPRGTGRGRPKVALEIVPEAAHVVGIKLGFNRHSAVLVDFAGNVLASANMPSPTHRSSMAQLLEETSALVDKLLNGSGKSRSDILSLGVGMPGIIDHATGTVVWSSILETREENLRAALSERFGIPVSLDNDANTLTLAELWFGEGRAIRDFAVVTVEAGVGMGLVLNGQLYRGAHGMGLELGHTKVQLDGALCQCGQRGCLEAYIADYALAREAATALGHGSDGAASQENVFQELFDRARSGNPAAETIFRRAGRYLSLGLSNVVQLFDPALIILSGERLQYAQFYADELLDGMRRLTLNEGRQPCRVAINAWDDLAWTRGASALALSAMTDQLIGGEARAT